MCFNQFRELVGEGISAVTVLTRLRTAMRREALPHGCALGDGAKELMGSTQPQSWRMRVERFA